MILQKADFRTRRPFAPVVKTQAPEKNVLDKVLMTKEIFESGKSITGGWNKKQLNALGIRSWFKGWKKQIINKEFSQDQIDSFLLLKNYNRRNNSEITESDIPFTKSIKPVLTNRKSEMVKITSEVSYKEQYNHPNWQRKRLEIMERDEFKCMLCGNKHKMLHVHHNTYDGKYIWECRNQSMITLCVDCHSKYHGKNLMG